MILDHKTGAEWYTYKPLYHVSGFQNPPVIIQIHQNQVHQRLFIDTLWLYSAIKDIYIDFDMKPSNDINNAKSISTKNHKIK